MPESVIIAGKLTDEELKRSIDKLVEDIDEKMGNAADKFGKHLDTMQSRLKDFSTSISSLKNDVKDMSSSFDNIAKSTKAATTGSTKANASGYAPNTASNALLGELEQAKKETENLRKGFQANGTEVKRLTNQIEDLKRRIKEAKTASPKSIKEVLGMDESSVNAIATKMRALKAIQVNSKNAAEVARLGTEYQRLAKLQSDLLGRNNLLIQSNNGLARSFGYIRNRLVYALTIGAASSFVKQVYEIRGQYELLERSLGVLTNSFQKGRQIFQELNAMAIKSPFTLMDLAGAAKQLTAYNFSADEVVGTTRRLADISAALGVPMERLVYNLGQIRAQTVLTARDARDFANAGLPIVTSLANHYSELEGRIVSTGDVYDRMSKKMVSYTDVMAVINQMTDEGGRFFDFQAKQANTLKVQMMNLSLAWNNMLNEIGQQHQSMLATPLSALKTLFENWKTLDKVIWDVVAVLGVVKTAQVALNLAMGTGNAAIKSQILTNKQKIASDLERKAITEALTASEQKTLLTRRQVTAADYEQVLSSRALTKQQALMMVAFRGRDTELMKALVRMNLLTAAEVRAMTTGKALTIVFRSMGLSLKTIGASMAAALPMLAATAAIGGAIHLWQTYNEQIALTAELNKELVDNAKESSDALDAFLSNKGNKAARDLAAQNKLTSDEGQKAWEAISQELKTSASSANELLSELLTIDNINERVAKGFDYAERIRQANVAMQDLKDDTIKFSQTSIWHGEGLADDLKDFANSISRYQGNYEELQEILSKQDFSSFAVRDTFTEFRNELNVTAESITDFINAHNITDPLQISEILERAKASIKSKNPEIKGELAQIFDITLDQRMAELTNNAVDKNASLWKIFLDRLKNNLGSAFDNITEENVALNGKLSQQQQQAVDKNLEYFKNTMPFYYNAVKDMVSDASKLRIQIGIAFNVQQFTDFQKEIRNRINNAPKMIDFGSEAFLPIEKDDLVSWVDTQQKAIKKLNEENKLYEKDNSAWAKERIASNNKEISQRTSLLSLFNQSAKAEEKRRSTASGGTKKDILGGALTEEIRLISEIQKKYKEYRELGVNAQDSIAKATQEYGKSLVRNNAILNKYGIQTLTSDELAKLPLQKVRDFYSEQLKIANALGNTKGIEALEKIIANINLEITKIDYKKISEGLNNELNKLKEEYELGVELDANPELGSLFLDLFDIDPNNLTKTIDDYANKVLGELNKSFEKRKIDFRLPTLDLTKDDIKSFQEQVEGGTLDKATFDLIKQKYNEIRALRSKDATETLRQTQELQYKLADVNGKIAIEQKKLSDLQIRYEKETREEKKKLLELEIEDQKQTIQKLGEEVLQMLPFYEKLFGNVADHSARVTRKLAKDAKALAENAKKNADGSYTITDENGKSATISAKEYGKLLDKINKKLRETESSWAKIKEAFTKGEDKVIDISEGFALLGSEIQNIANEAKELSDVLSDVGVNFSDDINYAIEGLGQAGEGMAEAAQGYASGNYIQMAVGATKALVGFGKTFAGIFGGSKKDYFTPLKESLENLLEVMNKVSSYQLEALGRMTGSQAASEYRKLLQNNETIIQSYRDLANAAGRSGSSWGSHSYAYRTNRNLKGDWEEISKYANETVTSIQDMYNLDPSQLKEIMTNMPTEWAKIDKNIREALESIIEYGDKAQEYTIALGEALTNISLDDLTNDFEGMLQDMDSKSEDFAENFEEYMRNAIIRSMMVGTYAEELENWYNNFKERIKDDELSEQDVEALRQEYMDIVNRALEERGRLTSVIGEAARQGDLSALQQGIQGITETTANALEAYMNSVSQQVYYQSSLLESINTFLQGFNNDVSVATQAQMLLQLQQSYQVQMAIQNILIGWSNPSGQAIRVEMI